MIYKVFFQAIKREVPVRERTQTVYVEANSEKDVRLKLAEKDLNIEFIQPLDDSHLEYEKRSEYFVLENV
ncbi:DNA-dependent RNA polymerase subunit epsilon [Calidifontibacillus oryziterrae]|uniref:DNA-dependent RNA polymerase subunit epsilon n=1 Tax=Calidifontibacillus oryziterrae TaxID=1191699 RepID=UPI0002FD04D2|nr:DNA-directed RNA polymerase subunit epsilon [Calidifontibacillus oryziterrae]